MKTIFFPEKKETYQLFNKIAFRYDFMNHLLSLGLDIYWRRYFRKFLPSHLQNIDALDLATGTGDVAFELALSPKVNKIVATDLSAGMLELAQKKSLYKKNAQKIEWSIGDGVEIPFSDNSFNVVTLSFGLRNFHDPLRSLQNIYRVLKPGGQVMIMEFSLPPNPLIRKFFLCYFRHSLPFIGHLFTGHGEAYRYFNQSVENFPYGENFVTLLKENSFKKIVWKQFSFGIASLYIGIKE